MSSLESRKNLAGIGSILSLLGFIPTVGWVIAIVGVILLLMGIKGLASYYQDDAIYRNALSGLICYAIAIVFAAVAIGAFAFGSIFTAVTVGSLLGLGIGIFLGIIALIIASYSSCLQPTAYGARYRYLDRNPVNTSLKRQA